VDVKAPVRTRRAEKSERTRQAILDAAAALFTDPGYSSTTIEAIAQRADVAVETVYKRFRNKPGLLLAILEPAIVGNAEGVDLLELPAIAEIRSTSNQQEQLHLLARFSRGILERTLPAQRILASAAVSDPAAAELQQRDRERRRATQQAYVELLLANGPLPSGLSPAEAADTYGVLANPHSFELLVVQRGWSPERYERWLGDSLARLLLLR
jgi:AcrR family transcriptional regulator